VGSHTRYFAYVLQFVLSVVCSLLVLWAMVRAYPRLPPLPPAHWKDVLPVLLPTLVGAVWMLGLRLRGLPSIPSRYFILWYLFWPAVTGALAGLTLACAWLRTRLDAE
jgi:hypothetical protein